ncbi:MAG: hypothetical protein UDF26_00590, partial [Clostridia bacterium]|nr:hypothetical protein [Clostridia bacterium]
LQTVLLRIQRHDQEIPAGIQGNDRILQIRLHHQIRCKNSCRFLQEFFMECGVRRRAPGLRIKTENKGFAGSQAQTAPAL